MKNLGKLSIIIVLLVFLIFFIFGVLFGYGHYSNKGVNVLFKNESNEQIESVVIHLHGSQCGAQKLAMEGSLNCAFRSLGDSSYDVHIKLEGKPEVVKNNMGYVTGGMNFNDVITFTNLKEIKLNQTFEQTNLADQSVPINQ